MPADLRTRKERAFKRLQAWVAKRQSQKIAVDAARRALEALESEYEEIESECNAAQIVYDRLDAEYRRLYDPVDS